MLYTAPTPLHPCSSSASGHSSTFPFQASGSKPGAILSRRHTKCQETLLLWFQGEMLLASSWERPRHAARHPIMHRKSSPFPPAKTHPEQWSWGWETLLWVPGTLTFSPKQPISRVCSSHHLVTCEWLFERDVGKPWVCGMGCPHASVRPPPSDAWGGWEGSGSQASSLTFQCGSHRKLRTLHYNLAFQVVTEGHLSRSGDKIYFIRQFVSLMNHFKYLDVQHEDLCLLSCSGSHKS